MIDVEQYKKFITDKQENYIRVDWDVIEDLIEERNDMEMRFKMVLDKMSFLPSSLKDYFTDEENRFLFPEDYEDEDESEDDD